MFLLLLPFMEPVIDGELSKKFHGRANTKARPCGEAETDNFSRMQALNHHAVQFLKRPGCSLWALTSVIQVPLNHLLSPSLPRSLG